MRKWLLGVALLLVALSLPFGKSTVVSAQAPDNYGWWWLLREPKLPVDPRPLSPIPIPAVTIPNPPTIPEDGMYVEGAATQIQAISAVTFVIPEGATATTLTLLSAVPFTPNVSIMLCTANSSWRPEHGGRWQSKPLYGCPAKPILGVVATDGSKITWTLGDLGKQQLIDVVLVPAPTSAFQATFAKPGKDALTVIGADKEPTLSDLGGTGAAVLGSSNEFGSLGNALNDPSSFPSVSPFLDSNPSASQIGQAPLAAPTQSRPVTPVVAAAPAKDTNGRLAFFGLLALAVLFTRLRSEPSREPKSLVNFGKNSGAGE